MRATPHLAGALLMLIAVASLPACSSSSSAARQQAAASSASAEAAGSALPTAGPASCPQGLDYLELDHYPPGPDAASDAGGYYWVASQHRCVTTPNWVRLTQPADSPRACTYLALARDNPGYDVDATNPAPLHNVRFKIGKGCQ
jgi:hypothetical protein